MTTTLDLDKIQKLANDLEPGSGSSAWNHADNRKPGDLLVGSFLRMDDEMPTKNGAYEVAIIESAMTGEEEQLVLWHAGLKAQWADANPKPDDMVLVKWFGMPDGWKSWAYAVRILEAD